MNYGRYFMPGMNPYFYGNPRGIGFIGRAINGIKSFNWKGLLNGANKTLNVVNQTIPLVRQAKPMFNNMRSMIKLAKSFGKETSINRYVSDNKTGQKKEVRNDNYPNFFI